MAQGRSATIISMIKWIRTSRFPIKNCFSTSSGAASPPWRDATAAFFSSSAVAKTARRKSENDAVPVVRGQIGTNLVFFRRCAPSKSFASYDFPDVATRLATHWGMRAQGGLWILTGLIQARDQGKTTELFYPPRNGGGRKEGEEGRR